MTYKVLIPAAGLGSRLKHLTKKICKPLVTLNNKPIIQHVIEKFPKDCEFVVCLGYKGNLLKEYLEFQFKKYNFIFVYVDDFSSDKSGLGLTISKAENYLKEPFIFCSSDTVVHNEIVIKPNHDWMAISEEGSIHGDIGEYRTVTLKNNKPQKFLQKLDSYNSPRKPYIGLCGIKSYEDFWNTSKSDYSLFLRNGESLWIEKKVINKDINLIKKIWTDGGNLDSIKRFNKKYNTNEINILPKEEESIWFINNEVIKFSTSDSFINGRIKRSKYLTPFVPLITDYSDHFYKYKFLEGNVLSKKLNVKKFQKLLYFLETFWNKKAINQENDKKFEDLCLSFYKEKTLKRIEALISNYPYLEDVKIINDKETDSVKNLLNKIDWPLIASGCKGRIHGDLHFENIIYSEEEDNFKLLDWRQDFAGLYDVGDIYYDLAKLLHGILISHQFIMKNDYSISVRDRKASFNIKYLNNISDLLEVFFNWTKKNKFNIDKIINITSLIYLNIATLHHYPYNNFLYFYGRFILGNNLNSLNGLSFQEDKYKNS